MKPSRSAPSTASPGTASPPLIADMARVFASLRASCTPAAAQIKVKGILLQIVGRRYRRLRVRIDGAETGHLCQHARCTDFPHQLHTASLPLVSSVLLQRR